MSETLREELAELCHEQWSLWMVYIFEHCIEMNDELIVPEWAVERWKRQMETPYSKLTEDEKNSDRFEADKFLKLLKGKVIRI